jgi:hypothetical protein
VAEPVAPEAFRLRRPVAEDAAGIEHRLRQVPCPFVTPLRFEIWQAVRPAGLQETAADPELVLPRPAEAALAVAIELPELTGERPEGLLTGLTQLAAVLGASTQTGGPFLDQAGWWIRAAGSDWFVTVHADCYPCWHSRHWPRAGAMVVLVPRLAFDQGFPAGVPDSTRQAIRAAFKRRNIRYPAAGGAIAGG